MENIETFYPGCVCHVGLIYVSFVLNISHNLFQNAVWMFSSAGFLTRNSSTRQQSDSSKSVRGFAALKSCVTGAVERLK